MKCQVNYGDAMVMVFAVNCQWQSVLLDGQFWTLDLWVLETWYITSFNRPLTILGSRYIEAYNLKIKIMVFAFYIYIDIRYIFIYNLHIIHMIWWYGPETQRCWQFLEQTVQQEASQ